jgi:hypothetical protein
MDTRTFDRYAAPGTMPVDMIWIVNYPATVADQIRDMVPGPDAVDDDVVDMAAEIVASVATAIHGEVCDCDDKTCETTGEIRDWLKDGSFDQRPYTLAELVSMWNDVYTGEALS